MKKYIIYLFILTLIQSSDDYNVRDEQIFLHKEINPYTHYVFELEWPGID